MDGEEIKAAILFYFIFVRKLTMSRRKGGTQHEAFLDLRVWRITPEFGPVTCVISRKVLSMGKPTFKKKKKGKINKKTKRKPK